MRNNWIKKEHPFLSGTSSYGGAGSLAFKKISLGGSSWLVMSGSSDANEVSEYGAALDIDADKNSYMQHRLRLSTTNGILITTKFDVDGNLVWQKQLSNTGTSGAVYPIDLKVNSSGDIYFQGTTNDSTTSGSRGLFGKYNSSGALQWTYMTSGGGGTGGGNSWARMALDSSNNFYFTGNSYNGTIRGYYACKFNTQTPLTYTWQRVIGDPNTNSGNGNDVIVDSSGNVYMVGSSNIQPGAHNTNTSFYDIAVFKWNSSGVLQWSRLIGTSPNITSQAYAVKLDSTESNIYVACSVGAPFTLGLMKISSSGTLQWQKQLRHSDPSRTGSFSDLDVDSNDNVYCVGGAAVPSLSPKTLDSVIIAKFSSSGNLQWQRAFTAIGYFANGNRIRLDNDGSMYVHGYTLESTTTHQPQSGNTFMLKLPDNGSKTGSYGGYMYHESDLVLTNSTATVVNDPSAFTETAFDFTNTTKSLTAANSTNTIKLLSNISGHSPVSDINLAGQNHGIPTGVYWYTYTNNASFTSGFYSYEHKVNVNNAGDILSCFVYSWYDSNTSTTNFYHRWTSISPDGQTQNWCKEITDIKGQYGLSIQIDDNDNIYATSRGTDSTDTYITTIVYSLSSTGSLRWVREIQTDYSNSQILASDCLVLSGGYLFWYGQTSATLTNQVNVTNCLLRLSTSSGEVLETLKLTANSNYNGNYVVGLSVNHAGDKLYAKSHVYEQTSGGASECMIQVVNWNGTSMSLNSTKVLGGSSSGNYIWSSQTSRPRIDSDGNVYLSFSSGTLDNQTTTSAYFIAKLDSTLSNVLRVTEITNGNGAWNGSSHDIHVMEGGAIYMNGTERYDLGATAPGGFRTLQWVSRLPDSGIDYVGAKTMRQTIDDYYLTPSICPDRNGGLIVGNWEAQSSGSGFNPTIARLRLDLQQTGTYGGTVIEASARPISFTNLPTTDLTITSTTNATPPVAFNIVDSSTTLTVTTITTQTLTRNLIT